MYSLIEGLGRKQFAIKELPSFAIAMIVAELFYKFHSFTLECLAFLVTWAAFSWIQEKVLGPARIARDTENAREIGN